ncbi:hypothetical protein D3C75_1071960 [compost metagenome]
MLLLAVKKVTLRVSGLSRLVSTLSITCLLRASILGWFWVMWVCNSRPTLVVKLPTIWFISSPMTLLTSSEVWEMARSSLESPMLSM